MPDITISKADWDAKKGAIGPAIEQSLNRMGSQMQVQAQGFAPVRAKHGSRLRSSITHTVVNTGSDAFELRVGTNVEYAPYVEYGTGERGQASGNANYRGHESGVTYTAGWPGMTGKPYLRPAVYDLETELVEDLKRNIMEALQ